MLCVIAKIDPKSKARFLKLQGKIEKLGISVKALHGHITLVSYIGEDEAAFIASCKEILSSCKVFPVCYDKIEVLASSCIAVRRLVCTNCTALIFASAPLGVVLNARYRVETASVFAAPRNNRSGSNALFASIASIVSFSASVNVFGCISASTNSR